MTSTRELFRQNLVHFLSERGFSQLELAKRINVSPATVSDWVNGNKPATFDNLDKIAYALNTSSANLLIDRFSIYNEEEALADELMVFIHNNKDAEWIVRKVQSLSKRELYAFRNIMEQIDNFRADDNAFIYKKKKEV